MFPFLHPLLCQELRQDFLLHKEKQTCETKAANSPQGATTLCLQLAFYGPSWKNISFPLQSVFNEPIVLLCWTNKITLLCDYVQFLLWILKEPILKFWLARKQYIYIQLFLLKKKNSIKNEIYYTWNIIHNYINIFIILFLYIYIYIFISFIYYLINIIILLFYL